MKRRPWTSEEEKLLITTHHTRTARQQARKLRRPYSQVVAKRMQLYKRGAIKKEERRYHPDWSEADQEFLRENYARLTPLGLQRHLHRSWVAIILKKKRLGGIWRNDGSSYTAREIGRLFGKDAKWITKLAEEGFIKGHRAPYQLGHYQPWAFLEEDITDFVRKYPWLIEVRKMEDGQYFRNLVKEEWDRDPWCNLKEAARLVGITPMYLHRRLKSGEVEGFQRSPGRRWSLWGIRRSALKAFRRHDTPEERSARTKVAYRKRRVRAGLPYILRVVWGHTCQECGQETTVEATSHVKGAEVLRMVDHKCGGTIGSTGETALPGS